MTAENASYLDISGEDWNVNSTHFLGSLPDNATDVYSFGPPILPKIHKGGLITTVLLLMLAMGCDMNLSQIKSHIRHPVSVIIGMTCQFVIMPLFGFSLIRLFGIDGFYATGILLAACCPGGSLSNILSYLMDGDIALSVTMTTLSTTFALVIMPFNMWLFGQGIHTGTIVIPYVGISTSLLLLTAPVAVGMLINWKLPQISPHITKMGGRAGLVIILALSILEAVVYHKLYILASWHIYVACFSLISLGYVTGYCTMWIFKYDTKLRRTVGIESAIQNAPLSNIIASLSFEYPGQLLVRLFPIVYSSVQAVVGFLAAAVFRVTSFTKENRIQEKHLNTLEMVGR